MEILRMNELKKSRSLSIYGAVLRKTSAFQEKIKQEQVGESQIVRGYCDVYHSFDPTNQNGKISQHRDPELGENSTSRKQTISFFVQARGNASGT